MFYPLTFIFVCSDSAKYTEFTSKFLFHKGGQLEHNLEHKGLICNTAEGFIQIPLFFVPLHWESGWKSLFRL
jgi:hypothetical protein